MTQHMTLQECVAQARERGFNAVRTGAGVQAIERWDPYGVNGRNREFFEGAEPLTFAWVADDAVIDSPAAIETATPEGPVCVGRWRFTRGGER